MMTDEVLYRQKVVSWSFMA